MKIMKKIVSFLSLILLIGGMGLMLYTYLTNHTFVNKLTSLMTNADCKKGMLYMLIGIICMIAAFLLFSLSVRMGSSIRRKEREMAAQEKARREEEEAKNRRLEEEAAAARADAERFKTEAIQAQALLQSSAAETKDTEI
ncbi:MAG: DUF3185 family protein [Solobacterium sp.]|nr:DUF3185 family protein [Solobacterium sp.]MBQ9823544.1 DUF3185 family protein [Solobacterium sp.]